MNLKSRFFLINGVVDKGNRYFSPMTFCYMFHYEPFYVSELPRSGKEQPNSTVMCSHNQILVLVELIGWFWDGEVSCSLMDICVMSSQVVSTCHDGLQGCPPSYHFIYDPPHVWG